MKKNLFFILLIFSLSLVSAQKQPDSNVGMASAQIHKVFVSPNPASSQIKIISNQKENIITRVSVYSIIGNEVINKTFNTKSSSVNLDVQKIKKGKYLIRVFYSNGATEVTSLIKL